MAITVKDLLHNAAYTPEEIEHIFDKKNPSFVKFDPELGYLFSDYIFSDGIYASKCQYNFEPHGWHRKMVNFADSPCRINTYGNSFTMCAQVSNGETWQEFLAAHFREPIRNFGVGGFGVYQAYRRTIRTEKIKDLSAEYIVLNIWDDDHIRNLDATRWIRVAWTHKDLYRGGGDVQFPAYCFPWAHLRYDLDKNTFVEVSGLCGDKADLRRLTDRDSYYEIFKNDIIANLYTLVIGGQICEEKLQELEALAKAFNLEVNLRNQNTKAADAKKLHITFGLKSTLYIIDQMRDWAEQQGKKLLVMLSYDVPAKKEMLEKQTRFDDELVDYLEDNNVTYVDTLLKLAEDYKAFNLGVDDFLERFYIPRAGAQVFGHYSPSGNFWFAYSVRDALLDWLSPKPPAYL